MEWGNKDFVLTGSQKIRLFFFMGTELDYFPQLLLQLELLQTNKKKAVPGVYLDITHAALAFTWENAHFLKWTCSQLVLFMWVAGEFTQPGVPLQAPLGASKNKRAGSLTPVITFLGVQILSVSGIFGGCSLSFCLLTNSYFFSTCTSFFFLINHLQLNQRVIKHCRSTLCVPSPSDPQPHSSHNPDL